jgi:predicted GNAT family N-acyltransferase
MNENDFMVRPASWKDERRIIMAIRREVFIEEQHVPETLEWDGQDATALHVLALYDGTAVGTGRLLYTGQIGRMAVRRELRNRGIGTFIMHELIKLSRERNINCLFLNAQAQAAEFYRKQGFIRKGEVFDDAGIVHCRMEYQGG